MPTDIWPVTDRRPRRPLLAAASAAGGSVVGGILGVYGGFWLASRRIGSPRSENVVFRILEGLVEAVPYVWLGALLGAVLGWLVLPAVLGSVMKWPKIWLALGVQVIVGIAVWLTSAYIASVLDVGAISWVFVVLMIVGPPAAGRWFVDRGQPQIVPTDDVVRRTEHDPIRLNEDGP